jgi:mRNA-degrading endonuclease YafQ of YafQ-DinJ toxin-antitoxin module
MLRLIADNAPLGPEWLDHPLRADWADHRGCQHPQYGLTVQKTNWRRLQSRASMA